jgi:hypothetical protein
MKKLFCLIILLSTIINANSSANKYSGSNSDLPISGNTALYQRYLSKWVEFYTLFTLPVSFEVLKSKFLQPKDNPKFKQYKERLKSEVIDPLIRSVTEYGSNMQQNAAAQPNLQLYSDQAYMSLVTFGSSDVYQHFLAKQNDFSREIGDIPKNATDEFKRNFEEAEEKFKCLDVLPQEMGACEDNKNNFLITKNKATAQKYYELLLPITNRYVDQAYKVYQHYASLVRALKVPDDKAVKFAVESNAQTVYNLIVSLFLIEQCADWYNGNLFEKPE